MRAGSSCGRVLWLEDKQDVDLAKPPALLPYGRMRPPLSFLLLVRDEKKQEEGCEGEAVAQQEPLQQDANRV